MLSWEKPNSSKKSRLTVPKMSNKNPLRTLIRCKNLESILIHYRISLLIVIHYRKWFPILIHYRGFREKLSTTYQIRLSLRRKTPDDSRIRWMTLLGFGLRREAYPIFIHGESCTPPHLIDSPIYYCWRHCTQALSWDFLRIVAKENKFTQKKSCKSIALSDLPATTVSIVNL